MNEGLTIPLCLAGLTVVLAGFLVLSRMLSAGAAAAAAIVKAAIPFLYFAVLFDGTWTHWDDWHYLENAVDMVEHGYGPVSALMDAEGLLRLRFLSMGNHILYGWWNLVACTLFGPYYFSAIFLNVTLTFPCALLLYRVALLWGFGRQYSLGLALFFLFHWDMLAWSSLVNLKDILVMAMTLTALYLVARMADKPTPGVLAGIGLVTFLFAFLRFYVPFFVFLAGLIWMFPRMTGWRKYAALAVPVGAWCLIGWMAGWDYVLKYMTYLQPGEIVQGVIRMLLTPQPWSVDPSYGFLLYPSILHWVAIIPAAFGAALLFRGNQGIRLMLWYLFLTLLLYGSYEELQGPRHRIQVLFITSWCQFHFLAWISGHIRIVAPAHQPSPAAI